MQTPLGGKHVRQMDIKLPYLLGTPTISVTLAAYLAMPDPLNPDNVIIIPGPVPHRRWLERDFVISNIVFHVETGYLGCKISATNIWNGKPSDLAFVCNYIVTGKAQTNA